MDITKITSLVKSWIYADQLVKPEELVLFRSRKQGGLNLCNIKYRALAEQIKSFLDTAVNPKYRRNEYHKALYDWHVLELRTSADPGRPPYFSEAFFQEIKKVKNEGLLNIYNLSLSQWYKVLMENHVTSEIDEEGFRFEKRCKVEAKHPNVDWQRTWSLANIKGLESENYSFLWKLIHNLLPTQERLHKILPNITSPTCTVCELNEICDLEHAFFRCTHNCSTGQWLLQQVRKQVHQVEPQQVLLLDFNLEANMQLPYIWLISNTLRMIWDSRMEKKSPRLPIIRAKLEAGIMLLRKTRNKEAATILSKLLGLAQCM